MLVDVLNFRPPLEERISGLMVGAFALEVLVLDSSPSSAGRSCILAECCSNVFLKLP